LNIQQNEMDKIHTPTKSTKVINRGHPRDGVSGNLISGLTPPSDGLRLEAKTRELKDGTPSSTPRIRPLSPGLSETDTSWDTPDFKSAVPRGVLTPLKTLSSPMMAHAETEGLFSLPPPLHTTLTRTHVFRFISTSASAAVISTTDLTLVPGVMAVTALLGYSISSSVRLRSVKIWPPAGGSSVLYWSSASGREKDDVVDRTLPTGITVTGASSFSPPTRALAGFWFEPTTNLALFSITSSVGSIVDVRLTVSQTNAIANGSVVLSGATPGFVYYPSLDGVGGTYSSVGFV
jgi:hypothetical protein